MSTGLLALIDDVVALAKAAAVSLDDIAGMSAKAGTKSLGVVIDDAAVTPRYATGFAPARELPIVFRIARGSLKNKLLILLPAALVLSIFAPWAITPILMLGGAYLCFEGAEKTMEAMGWHGHGHAEANPSAEPGTPKAMEDARVRGAIQTDMILSAEIMAIALAGLPDVPLWQKAMVLAVVALGITVLVYGAVALIVKADDFGLALARREANGKPLRAFGRGIVRVMPGLLNALAAVGTAAMLWVGGGILVHGLEGLGIAGPAHLVHDIAHGIGHLVPALEGVLAWLVGAILSALVGLVVGLGIAGLVGTVLAPVLRLFGKGH